MCVCHILYTDTRPLLSEVGAQPLTADHGVEPFMSPHSQACHSLIWGGEVMKVSISHCILCGSRDRDKIEARLVRFEERGAKNVLRHSLSRLSPVRHGV